MTTRGFQEEEFRQVARWITTVLKNPEDETLKAKLRQEVMEMTARYPLIRES